MNACNCFTVAYFDITDVRYVEKYVLDIVFRDGTERRVDFQVAVGYAFSFEEFKEGLDWNEDRLAFKNEKQMVMIFGLSVYDPEK